MRFKQWLLTEKHGDTHSFSSTHVEFPKEVAQKVVQWGKKHIPNNLLVENEKASGREDEIHVTALYGLHTESPKEVRATLKQFKSFNLTLGKISKFGGDGYDVIKIDIQSDVLRKVHRALQQLDYTSSYKIYRPHCTIAYVKEGSCDDLLGNKDLEGTKVPAKAVTFSSKGGEKTIVSL